MTNDAWGEQFARGLTDALADGTLEAGAKPPADLAALLDELAPDIVYRWVDPTSKTTPRLHSCSTRPGHASGPASSGTAEHDRVTVE